MNEIISYAFTAIIGGVVAILVQRYSKTRQERNVELSERLSQITLKTAEQWYARLSQLDEQADRVRELTDKLDEYENKRAERDRQIAELKENNEALLSKVAALEAQIKKDATETSELIKKYEELKSFTRRLIAALEKNGIQLPELNGGLPDSIRGWKWEKPS